MSNPLFSIVTISYNQREFLGRAIDSVGSQQGVSVQHIVCDPGSTDGSRELADAYGDMITERVYERDSGPADGLNRGFSRATGEFYGYLNSDDTYLPSALARVARHFREHPGDDVVVGHALITDRHDRVLRRAWSEPYSRRLAAYGVTSHLQPSTFFRAEAFRRTPGFNPRNTSSWDSELMLEFHLAGARIGVVDAFLSTYRLHRASITNTGAQDVDAKRFHALRFHRLMGRNRRGYDRFFDFAFRVAARLRSPRGPIERLLKGPVHRRGIE